ncbi:MAG: hypothetical protein ACI4VI_08775 [Acutalibacteraceae bacterium]
MIEYGIILNGQLIRHKKYHSGDKEIIYTEEPTVSEGFRTAFSWEETENEIVQVWLTVSQA